MAYVDQSTGRNQRATVMVAVALLQGAAFIALVNGLTVHFTKDPPLPNPIGEHVEVPLPPLPVPPDVPKDDVKPRDTEITRENTTIDNGQAYRPPETSADPPENSGQTRTADPQPQPQPQPPPLPPSAARPMGRAGDWVTTSDYPTRDLREGNQGVTGVRLTIGTNGRVQSCIVTSSSGFRGLDDATCRNLTRRARFRPATDGNGNPVTGEYANNIRWVIPD